MQQQMFGAGPDACSAKVCLNAGGILAGKRGIHDRQGFDGNKFALILSELPSYPCRS